MTKYEILSIIISSLGLISVVIIFFQLRSQNLQIISDHERTRRQMTIDLMMEWTKTINNKCAIARKIIELLDDENCKKIYNIENASIPISAKALLVGILDKNEEDLQTKGDYIKITEYDSSILRGHVLHYLNSLECVLSGWRISISDKKIIEEEFEYIYNKEKDKCVLESFRTLSGVHNYLSIKSFCDHLREKNKKEIEGKGKIA